MFFVWHYSSNIPNNTCETCLTHRPFPYLVFLQFFCALLLLNVEAIFVLSLELCSPTHYGILQNKDIKTSIRHFCNAVIIMTTAETDLGTQSIFSLNCQVVDVHLRVF